ncbi:hypothetical protein BDP27DRAFT_1403261 [Rhodocollybia butyracea]|uniref:Uncharacterized protein n=1 Tax=Rhodocollybia butyracea TaxID=206335 RepID=A0A9P5PUW0_9AGAR|nr:hypothetical protein BDP27DRAFT_1403261 [Rhodocollybia butyracea]
MHIRFGAAVLGLVATGCDIALTMRGEVQYIWRIWLDGATEQVSEPHCRIMMIFRLLTFSTMLMFLELVLVLRVYALYGQSRAVGIFLSLLLMSRIASSTYCVYNHVLRSPEKFEYTSHCVGSVNFDDARSLVWVLSCGILIVQLVIIALAMKRTVWDFRRYSHSLFSILNKDGLKVFGAIVCSSGCDDRDLGEERSDAIFFHISHFHIINFCCGPEKLGEPSNITKFVLLLNTMCRRKKASGIQIEEDPGFREGGASDFRRKLMGVCVAGNLEEMPAPTHSLTCNWRQRYGQGCGRKGSGTIGSQESSEKTSSDASLRKAGTLKAFSHSVGLLSVTVHKDI